MDHGGRMLAYAQFATDIAQRFALADSPASVAANCAYTGRITLQFADRDGNGRASAGDVINATLVDCGVPALGRTVSGGLRIEIIAATPTTDVDMQARMTVVDALRLTTMNGTLGVIVPGTLRGSIGVRWTQSATGSQLRAQSTAEDDLRFTATRNGTESTDTLRQIDVSRTTRYDLATMTGTMAFLFDMGTRGGSLRVRTPQPLQGDLNTVPKQFRIEAEAARGRVLRAERATILGSVPIVSTQLLEATGTSLDRNQGDWRPLVGFVKDVRHPLEVTTASDQGFGITSLIPWRGSGLPIEIDRISEQRTEAGVSIYRADALFQRPVISPPALTSPGSTITLQFDRALAEGSDLRFRLVDTSVMTDPGLPNWNISTVVTRRGALYEIRPTEPIRQGRQYYLQASLDGVNWPTDVVIRDARGDIISMTGNTFASIYTDYAVVARAFATDYATVAASAPARLRAEVMLRDGQSLVNSQWQQLSGPPMTLTDPRALETDATLSPGSPRAVSDVLMLLTVTDSLGNMDRIRVLLKVGDQMAQGAAFYTESGFGTQAVRREMVTGSGSIFLSPAGLVSPRIPGPTEGGSGTSFSVIPAGGAPLTAGTYSPAVYSSVAGALPGLMSRAYCNTPGSPPTGSFEVLDVGYAADGTVSRLALDFMQQCTTGRREYQRGSYRFNSVVPLKP